MIITINSNKRTEILKKLPIGSLFIMGGDNVWLVCQYRDKRKYIRLRNGLISDLEDDIRVEILQDSITLENKF